MHQRIFQLSIALFFVFSVWTPGWGRPSQADLTGNGRVEEPDLVRFIELMRSGDFRADLFVDGKMNHLDLLEVLRQWRGSLTQSSDDLVIRIGAESGPKGMNLALEDLSISDVYKTTTAANVAQAFLCFDKMEVQAPGGPPRVVFEADPSGSHPGKPDKPGKPGHGDDDDGDDEDEEDEEDDDKGVTLTDLVVSQGFEGSTAPTPLRKVELTGLDPAGQILGGIDLGTNRLNWIRLRVVQGFPNTYVVLVNGATADLEVPSGSFKIIAPGNEVILGEGQTELVIEFDPEKSIVKTGNDRYKLKPVTKLRVNQITVGDATAEFEN